MSTRIPGIDFAAPPVKITTRDPQRLADCLDTTLPQNQKHTATNKRRSFETSGAFRGVALDTMNYTSFEGQGYYLGRLANEYSILFTMYRNWIMQDGTYCDISPADYIVYSYQTPIAMHLRIPIPGISYREGWLIFPRKYSVTTSRHQTTLRHALTLIGEL